LLRPLGGQVVFSYEHQGFARIPFDLPDFVKIIRGPKPFMPKLVVLSDGHAGRSYELTTEKVTIGRVEDNTFQIAEASISSHHCEVFLRGSDVVIKDLNSTNGTFINGDKISESVLKPGQTLRLGQVDLKLDTPAAPAAAPAATAAAAKKSVESGPSQGVRLGESESVPKSVALDKNPGFAKKSNKANLIFIGVGVILALAIIIFIVLSVLRFGEIGQ